MALGFMPIVQAADAPLLASIFGDHVVLQRDRPINVYGTRAPGEEVTVTLSGATQQTDGRCGWPLARRAAGAARGRSAHPHARARRIVEQTVNDVLVGDVWLCSGQSNMEWPVRNTLNADRKRAFRRTIASGR